MTNVSCSCILFWSWCLSAWHSKWWMPCRTTNEKVHAQRQFTEKEFRHQLVNSKTKNLKEFKYKHTNPFDVVIFSKFAHIVGVEEPCRRTYFFSKCNFIHQYLDIRVITTKTGHANSGWHWFDKRTQFDHKMRRKKLFNSGLFTGWKRVMPNDLNSGDSFESGLH